MNKSITLLHFFILCFLVLSIVSCKKEEKETIPAARTTGELSLQEAKQWFDKYSTDNFPQARLEQQEKKEAVWNRAINHKFGKKNVLEIPLKYEEGKGMLMHTTKGTSPKIYSQKQGKKLSTLTKLLISKDKQGKFTLRIMKLIGEDTYLKKHNFNPSNNTFARKENDFTGMVLYYDWNEQFINGFQYEKGKLKREVSYSKQIASANGGRRSTCSTLYLDYYQQACYFNYAEGAYECDDWRYIDTDSFTSCEYLEEEGYDNGGGVIEEGDEYYEGGGGGGQASPLVQLEMPGLYKPGINVTDYFDCFSLLPTEGYSYKLTVYVQEPVPGSNLNASVNFDVGHTCIGFTKADINNPSNSLTQVIGYYPQTGAKAIIPPFPSVISQIHDNGGDTRYTVSITYEVTPAQFQEALNAASDLSGESYNLVYNNCTDYVFNIINRAGLSIPQNSGELIYTYGHHPGQLGYDLRALKRSNPDTNIDTNEGYTPISKGPC